MLPISTPDRLTDVARDWPAAGIVLTAVSGRTARALKDDTRALIHGDGRRPARLITTGARARGRGGYGLLPDVEQRLQRSCGADLI